MKMTVRRRAELKRNPTSRYHSKVSFWFNAHNDEEATEILSRALDHIHHAATASLSDFSTRVESVKKKKV
jgi:hypothetical protein